MRIKYVVDVYYNKYATEQIYSLWTYKDNIPNGKFQEWYNGGSLFKDLMYKNDKLDGEYLEYYIHNKIYKKYNYKDGKRNGECSTWWNNSWHHGDELKESGIYENDKCIKIIKIKDSY